MKSNVLILALAILAADLVVVTIAIVGKLNEPALMVALLNVVALFAIYCAHTSGVPILDAGRRRRKSRRTRPT